MQGKLLSKSPCNDDLFNSGAHKKLAKVIAKEIQNDPDCSIVGIDGGWGAGKSNLVGLIKHELSQKGTAGKYPFFTYDAWGHQSDLPRRTILEELISELTSENNPILESKDWKDELDNLLARKKRTSTKTVPRLNFAFIAIALMTALTPVITAISNSLTCPRCRIIFSASVYTVFILFVVIRQWFGMRKSGQKINTKNFFSELFLLYEDKIKEEEKLETISEREPSTRKFKEQMSKINADLFKSKKVLVVVIDNMDRLPKNKVLELWAAIHLFFSEEKYTNIRVIVPFDRAHIQNAFNSENIQRNNEVAVYGDDFINKTFYVVYSVPPPILSDWTSFFCDKWKEAFGKDSDIDKSVLQIYDMLSKAHSPRKIIAFINQFVTIRNLCDTSIEDKYIALYLFGRKNIVENPLEEILSPTYLRSLDFLYKEDERMKACISSLYYQLPVNNAMDVIFTREVTQELDEAKNELLDNLRSTTNYWNILNHSITCVTNVENAVLALNNHFNTESSSEASSIWEALYKKSKSLNIVQNKYHEYHKILMKNIRNKEEYYNHLIDSYLSSTEDGFNLSIYLDGIDALRETIGEMEKDPLLSHKKEVEPGIFLQLILKRTNHYYRYGLAVNEDDFDDYLVSQDQGFLAKTGFYSIIKDEYVLPGYKDTIKDLFKKNVHNLSIETNLLKRIKEIENIPFDIRKYFNDTQICNFCDGLSASDEMYPDSISMLIARYGDNHYLNDYCNRRTNQFDEVLVNKVACCIQSYINYGDLLLKAGYFTPSSFVSQIIKELTIGSYGISQLDIKKTLINFDTILEDTGIEPNLLFKKWSFCDLSSLKIRDIKDLPLSLFKQCKLIDTDLTKHCLLLAKNYLASIDQSSWSDSLKKDDYNLKLLVIHHPEQLQLFIDAFKESLRNYATGDSAAKIPSSIVGRVIEILKDQKYDLKSIFREIRDVFINSSNINRERLKYFGKWLFEYGCLEDRAATLNKILRSEFLDDNDIVALITQYPDLVIKIVKKSEDNGDFVKKLVALKNNNYRDDVIIERICDDIKPKN
ncbi:MAG: KAP family NTPase [Bacteroidota bacterium]|nr:KAP family NTPase [Bacteroidota bacterium]